jgi:hypothetical protein
MSKHIDGVWEHVVYTYNGSRYSVYYNGVEESTGTKTGILYPLFEPNSVFLIGLSTALTPDYLIGRMDEVGIWNRSLNSSEVADLYNSGNGITYSSTAPDSIVPTWKDNWTSATDQTKKGDLVYFNVTLEDNVAGGYYIFSFDDGTGSFVNDSPASWTMPQEIEIIKTITAIKNQEVRWKWYFNDNSGNNNETPIWSFIVANSPPNQTIPLLSTLSGKNLSTENLTCYNKSTSDVDNDAVVNIYNWYKNSQPLAVLNMPFENNANDYSGYGNDGTSYGTTSTDGQVGKALSFDGVDDYVDIPSSASMSGWTAGTIEMWLYLNSTPTTYVATYADIRQSDTYRIHTAFYSTAKPRIALISEGLTNIIAESPEPLSLNTWYHIVGTFDASADETKIWVNGVLKKTTTTAFTNLVTTANDYINIGGRKGTSSFNGSIDEVRVYPYALSSEQIKQRYEDTKEGLTSSSKIVAEETAGGDNYMCQVTPNDGEEDGETLNSSELNVLWGITFNVTDSYSGIDLNGVTISCNYSEFNQAGDNTNPYGPYGFPDSIYSCEFEESIHFTKTVIFTADDDKIIPIRMSEGGKLTVEEHTWLEAIYNCVVLGDCSLYNMLLEMNQTIGKIWEQTKPTDNSVITFENITNKVVDSTHNLTIDYTVNIPIKAGYSLGTYLPVRIGYWFLDSTNTTCYNQGDKPTGVEEPYCQPLIIETIGPMGGQVNFTVELQPSLLVGNYSIKRIIDIDPSNIWINYGQELISTLTMAESLSTYGISSKTTGEIMPEREGVLENIKSKITGAITGVSQLLVSGWQIVAIIGIIAGLLVVSIISRTILRLKKKVINLFFVSFILFFLFFLIIASNISFIEDSSWEQNLTPARFGAMVLGDINNDGYLDIISTGCLKDGTNNCEGGVIAKVYLNNGTTFNENLTWEQNLIGVGLSSLALGDINNDGKLDLALTGCDNSTNFNCYGNQFAKVYLNNGTSLVESLQWEQNLTKVTEGSLAFGDINNDGKLDLAQIGARVIQPYLIAKIYINNGTSLVESTQWQNQLEGVQRGNIAFGDINNDGKLDLVLSGYKESVTEVTRIYINNGTTLNENSTWEQGLTQMGESSVLLGDYDNDGDLDLVMNGHTTGDRFHIYNNNGTTLVLNQTDTVQGGVLAGLYSSSVAFGDIDNDGDLDLVGMGWEHGRTRIYENNNTIFQNDATAHLNISDDLYMGSLAFGDIDNDENLDLTVEGLDVVGASGVLIFKVFINNVSLTKNNTLPTPPTTFTSSYSVTNNNLTLGWGNGSDADTPSTGLYYNLMIGNSTTNNTIVSGVYGGESGSNEGGGGGANGYFGNMMQRKNITLDLVLPTGTYYWYVQTIDTGLAKSNWSERQSLTVNADATTPGISSVSSSSVTTSTATITWTTDEMANSSVHYGTTTSTSSFSGSAGWTMSHSISLSGLSTSTLYYYNVSSCDDSSNCDTSSQYNFTTSAETPPPGSPGGGGGGPSRITPITPIQKEFDIDFSSSTGGVLETKQGDVKTFSFNSEIKHSITTLSVTASSMTLLITSEPITTQMNVGETRQIDINNDKINDFSISLISIISGKAKFSLTKLLGADIVAEEEIEKEIKKEALFDVKVSLSNLFNIVKTGREVIAKVEVLNVNNIGQVDVIVDYYITTKEDNKTKLAEGSDTLAVEAVASFVRSLTVPYNLKAGKYLFNVDVKYQGKILASGKAEFIVIKTYEIFIAVGVVVLIIIGIFFYLWRIKKKEEKLEKKERKDIGTLKREIGKLKREGFRKKWKRWRNKRRKRGNKRWQ